MDEPALALAWELGPFSPGEFGDVVLRIVYRR